MARTRPNPGPKGDPNRPLPNPDLPRDKGNDGNGPHYTPWLLVRYQAGDSGGRPLAPGTVFWESPDVWTQGSQGINMPVAGEPTQVFARVSNLGMQDAVGVTIKYYWADPSVVIVEDPTKLISEITGALIPAGDTLVFQSPSDWTPIEVNNGHECLVVEAYISGFDPLSDPMHPVDDRHVGQKNEQLLSLQPGQQFHFTLHAFNFTRQVRDVVIEVRPGLIPRDFARRFGRPDMWQTQILDPVVPLPVTLHFDTKDGQILTPPGEAAAHLGRPADRDDLCCLAPPQATAAHRLRPGETRIVTVTGTLPPSANPAEVYVIRASQRIGNVIVGGYTLYLTQAMPRRR
jgi:hypothetical protein